MTMTTILLKKEEMQAAYRLADIQNIRCGKAKDFYKKLVQNDVPKEDARMFLPLGMTCNMTVTMNFRALRHFLQLRLSKRAQWEVQYVAREILKICQSKWPWLVEDLING